MPAASWRSIPARSISRCDTISASFGFSLRMGRKKRDSRMGLTLEESVPLYGNWVSQTGSDAKTQEKALEKPAKRPNYQRFHRDDTSKSSSWLFSCLFVFCVVSCLCLRPG